MSNPIKRFGELTIADLEKFPVWEFVNDDVNYDEDAVRGIKELPVDHLTGRIVGDRVRLSNGMQIWSIMSNVNANNSRATQQFLTLNVIRDGAWFDLARYFDAEFNERGSAALAAFLGLSVDQVFPISYDISRFCTGASAAMSGTIQAEPRERLTSEQIRALAVSLFSPHPGDA